MTEHEQQEQRTPKRDDPGVGPEGIALDLAAHTVVAVFDHFDHAQAAAHDLRAVGFRSADMSLVMRQSGAVPERGAGETQADEGTAAGATIGAVVGGIAGLAAVSIPGIGVLLAAGPIAAALGALTGSALDGLVGSFAGLGIPTEHAKDYDAAVRAGGIVIAVHAADRSADERANRILHQHGAREVASYTQARDSDRT